MSVYVCVNNEKFLCKGWHAAFGLARIYTARGYRVKFEV